MANQNDLINKQQHCISNYRQTNNNIVYQIIGKQITTLYIKIIGRKDIPFNQIGHVGPFVHFGNFGHFGCFGHFVQNVTNCDIK